ncbi:MAG: NUDIX domain-containing protein [Candidatus Blackburnbacteria bacterium]|nr:NUDIX domain-containing protein [Candidatus Blackburnbacteria bacterium]
MKQDFAFGGIIFKKENDISTVLLVKKPHFTSWDIPKGHKEDDETDKEGALRELAEETGYKNIELTDEKVTVSYEVEKPEGKIQKIVTFFVGIQEGKEVPEPKPDEDADEEGIEARWIPVNEALDLVTFGPFNSALQQAVTNLS